MTYSKWIRVSRRMASLAVAAVLSVGLMACDDGVTGTQESTLSVQMTDGEGADVESVWVDVTELRVVGQSGQGGGSITLLDDETDGDETTDGSEDLILLSPENVESLVQEAVLPSGTYGQLRLVIGGAVLETESGNVYTRGDAVHPDPDKTADGDLICPSCDETGIKIVPPGGALRLDAESKVLVLDFDVYQSFEAGSSGQWVMSPVILASELKLSGNIAGQISLADDVSVPECPAGTPRSAEDFAPQAESMDDDGVLKTGTVASDGSYEIQFVQAGSWTMTFDGSVAVVDEQDNKATLEFDADLPDPVTVTVEQGQTTSGVDYTVTSASCVE